MRRFLDTVMESLVVLGFLLLVGLGFVGICLRYLFSGAYALYWAEEVIRYGFIWIVWLIAPLALRRGALLGVDLAVQYLPPWGRRAVTVAGNVFVMVLLAGYVWYGIFMVRINWTQLSTALEFPMSWPYLALPVGAAALLVELAIWTTGGATRGGTGVPGPDDARA